jgi:hypothetical protein
MSKRKQTEINIPIEDKSFINGYKDGGKVVKMFKKDPNFNLKSYFDGLYNSYVNTLKSSYNFDKTVSYNKQTGISFEEPSKLKPEPEQPQISCETMSTLKTPVSHETFKNFGTQPNLKLPFQEPYKSFSFGLSTKPSLQEPYKSFSFDTSTETKFPDPKSFRFGLSTNSNTTEPKTYKSFNFDAKPDISFKLSTDTCLKEQQNDTKSLSEKFNEYDKSHKQNETKSNIGVNNETNSFW